MLTARSGASLIEVMLALALAGLAILGCVVLVDQLSDGSSRIGVHSAEINTHWNAERLLTQLLADARPAADSAELTRGSERSIAYASLCSVASGWSERCRVSIALDSLRDSTRLLVQMNAGVSYSVRTFAGRAHLRYLDPTNPDSMWTHEWAPSIGLPLAVAVVNGSDTTVLPIGPSRE